MNEIICCDWGTTILRTRFVNADEQSILAETVSNQGISATFELWNQTGKAEEKRESFYLNVIKNQIEILERQIGFSLTGMHLVVSGMASSNIGMLEIPYKEVPFDSDGSDLNVRFIDPTDEFRHEIFLISGVKTKDDVMRGEETQLAGCEPVNAEQERLFIFPGTHSKHVLVKKNKAVDFKTYMTGEFFSLLSRNSILSNNVEESIRSLDGDILKNFEEGVEKGQQQNLLHASFMIRTNGLFNRNTKKENYYYLSGLLIGTELKDLNNNPSPLMIVCNDTQKNYYAAALRKMGIAKVQFQDAVAATVGGQCRIYNYYKSASK